MFNIKKKHCKLTYEELHKQLCIIKHIVNIQYTCT